MNRDCVKLNLDECRTRDDCTTRKKSKTHKICVNKSVDPAVFRKSPIAKKSTVVNKTPVVTKSVVITNAPHMSVAPVTDILEKKAKLPFGREGSLCIGMNETDCDKAKSACQWKKESADGKRKAHCGKRGETKYESMNVLRSFNSKKYEAHELTPEEIKQVRWAKAADSANANATASRAARKGITELCAGLKETDCKKPSVQMSCKWTNPSSDGKRKGYCSKRTDSNLQSVATKKEMDKKFAELDKKKVAYGGRLDPVLRLFYGY